MADLISMLAAVAGSGGGADPNFNQTVLLLHGDGTNGAQNNTFLDGSTNNFTITRNGNTTQGTFSPFSLAAGEWSNFFDGTGDTLTAADNAAFDLGSGDWTIELWANFGSVSGEKGLVSHFATPALSTGYTLRLSTGNSPSGLRLVCSSGGGTDVILQAAWSPVVSVWYHIAAVRDGGTLRLYVDGVQIGSTSIAITIGNPSTTFAVGTAQTVASSDMNGYISNVRLVKGTCLYTGGTTFTPPTAPLTAISGTSLLTCQSNRFVDNSTNAFAITRNGDVRVTPFSPFAPTAAYSAGTNGGSGYFDGSGDTLAAPNNSALAMGTGDFTWELWWYPISLNNFNTLMDSRVNVTGVNGWTIEYGSPPTSFYVATSSYTMTSSSLPINSSWNHIVLVRSSTTLSLFINGSRTATRTDTFDGSNGDLRIGSNGLNGYVSNLREVKGTAVYDPTQTTLTVPTAPLTAISNTSLLLNFTNAGIIDNTGKNNLETVGNAQIDTAVKKFGTGSLEFDGNGDFLSIFATAELQLTNSSAFTIEFWVYAATLPSIGGSAFIIRAYNMSSPFQGYGIAFGGNASNTNLQLWNGTAWADIGTVSTTTWTHVAIAYEGSGSTLRYFINGTQQGSATTVPSSINWTGTQFILGARNSDFYFNGYIDDLRITKGVARYTANFTPPTAAFPNE